MKKVFLALAAVALLATACNKAPEAKIKVYGWQGEGGNTTEETLQADFSKWKSHGLDGMCYNAGHDLQKIQRAAKVAHANGMEYHTREEYGSLFPIKSKPALQKAEIAWKIP